MDEQIFDLARQKGATNCVGNKAETVFCFTRDELKGFALSMVEECFRIVDDYAVERAAAPETYLGESLKVSCSITDAAWKIKEHFGVDK